VPLIDRHIVAIDDTASILNFLRISLEAHGARFHGATTAAGGLAVCESDMPDLIVLDLGLPDKQGFDILPRLKHLNQNQEIPIIVLTVRNEQKDRDMARDLGASAYITKPFVMGALLEVILEKLHISPPPYLRLEELEEKPDYYYTPAASDSMR
jgi:two-component system KDP operon response regulator KdpE